MKLRFWQKKKRQIQIDVIHYERIGKTVKTKAASRWVELGQGLTEGLRVPLDARGDHGVDVKITEFEL